ncbi:MAG: riboflavin synthase [Mariprofundaceae bacterium]
MFTGIIMDVGRIEDIQPKSGQTHMAFSTALATSSWQAGDSIAVDGCCLTITDVPKAGLFVATLSLETLDLTCFPQAAPRQEVNLEPALRLGDPLGGHWLTGHVDGVGSVVDIAKVGEHRRLTIELPQGLARYLVGKGSVAVNGASLTINAVDDCRFTVNLIPHTLAHTNLGCLQVGSQVNIETDILGRYVERLLVYQGQTDGEP